ncbi:hypothetical protein MNBD_ALPHA11-2060 [hydrothermal vent metagenome]|uniref:Uncharacterized protein n=1 Tax=hydrothermal vent metagenome TaxID=652676 RepID=A0A3B0TQ55_9ZZZZ
MNLKVSESKSLRAVFITAPKDLACYINSVTVTVIYLIIALVIVAVAS